MAAPITNSAPPRDTNPRQRLPYADREKRSRGELQTDANQVREHEDPRDGDVEEPASQRPHLEYTLSSEPSVRYCDLGSTARLGPSLTIIYTGRGIAFMVHVRWG